MKVTYAAQQAARNSAALRVVNGNPVRRAVDMFTEPQLVRMHHAAGNSMTATTILSELLNTEKAGYRLCRVFRDIKRTCERTLGIAY